MNSMLENRRQRARSRSQATAAEARTRSGSCATPVANLSPADLRKRGWLSKKGRINKALKSRWFQLCCDDPASPTLTYFASTQAGADGEEEGVDKKGDVDLGSVVRVDRFADGDALCLNLVGPQRTFHLFVGSEGEPAELERQHREWHRALSNAVALMHVAVTDAEADADADADAAGAAGATLAPVEDVPVEGAASESAQSFINPLEAVAAASAGAGAAAGAEAEAEAEVEAE